MTISKLKGLATGIGSLPYEDVNSALDLVFKYTPNIPFWPQLPRRDMREAMVIQASEGFPFIKIKEKGLILDAQDKENQLEIFYERIINKDTNYFKISESFASGLWEFYRILEKICLEDVRFIKCQLCGPFTFAASINDEEGKAILHDKVMLQAVLKGLTAKAFWQVELFKKFNKPIIIFFDEPYLGCFGSAYTPINREDVIRGLTEIAQEIKSEDVLVGLHCCGNTDWSIFTDIDSIDIISFDAFSFLDRVILYADDLKAFLERGGILCWGIVPTQEFTGRETADFLIEKLNIGIKALVKKGAEKNLLLNNLMLSPSCGLGTLDTQKAERIFKLLSETANKLFDKLI